MSSSLDKRVSLVGTIVPFVHFDVRSVDGRHAYVENLMKRLGRFLSFLPFILVASVACSNMQAALWSAFGVSTLIVLLNVYRSSYIQNKDKIMILDFCMWLAFLAQGILYEIVGDKYPCELVSPVNVSVILLAAVLSVMISYPFTIQIAKERVTPAIAAKPEFKTINMWLTGFWIILFVIMTALSWTSFTVLDSEKNSVAHIIVGTVLPILIPIFGGIATPYLADWLKTKRQKKAASHGNYNSMEEGSLQVQNV